MSERQEIDEPGQSTAPGIDPGTIRVLLVDDMSTNRELVKMALRKKPVDFVEAGNGQAALDKMAEQEFDIVLLDVYMPVMDGIEVHRRIRGNAAHARLPIIMLTAQDSADAGIDDLDDDATAYLSKPIDFHELWVRIQKAVEKEPVDQSPYAMYLHTMRSFSAHGRVNRNDIIHCDAGMSLTSGDCTITSTGMMPVSRSKPTLMNWST